MADTLLKIPHSCIVVFLGAGLSILLITTVLIVGDHFEGKLRSAMVAVVAASSGIGGMVYPYVLDEMSMKYTLQGKLLIMGGLFLNTIPAVYLWTPARKEKTPTGTKRQNAGLRSVLGTLVKKKTFIAFAIGTTCVVPTFNAFLALMLDIFYDILHSRRQCVTILLVFNTVSLVGRLLPGFLKNVSCLKTISFPIIFSLLGTIGFVTLNFVSGFGACLCVVALLSVSFGGMITILSVVTMRIVGIELFPVAVGVLYTMEGVCNSFIAPLTGLVRDATGSYTMTLVISSCALLIGSLLFTVAAVLQRQERRRQLDTKENDMTLTSVIE